MLIQRIRSFVAAEVLLTLAVAGSAQQGQAQARGMASSSSPETDFIVLSSDHYVVETPRDCSGKVGFFKGLCEGQGPRREDRCTTLLADAQRLHSYTVECREPLTAGQKVSGYVRGGNLVLQIDGKTRTYGILKSRLLESTTEKKKPNEDADSAGASALAQRADVSPVSIKSNPDGADITVDGKYVGSTPSIIRLATGDHEIEIRKPGFKAWERKMAVTTGGKVTVDATLEKEIPQ
jgi:hypothetical protein